jgi:YidC/Oxa1 family membrane protein insertase
MQSQRSFLYIALVLVSFLLFQEWQKDYNPQPVVAQQQPIQTSDMPASSNHSVVSSDLPTSDGGQASVAAAAQTDRLIKVKTNVLDLVIDTRGGDIIGADLLNYPIIQGEPEPVHLLAKFNLAQSGLIGRDGPDSNRKGRPFYLAKQLNYQTQGDDDIVIPLTWTNNKGLTVTKTFTIKANEYDIVVSYTVKNNGTTAASVQPFGQLKKIILAPETTLMMNAYNAATYSTAEAYYEKYDMDDMVDKNLNKNTLGGWIAMQQHYFVAAWVPPQEQQNNIFSKVASDGSAIIGYKGPTIDIMPGDSEIINATLYAGPKNQEALGKLSESLELTVDYGPLFFISQVLFDILIFLYSIVGNWGVSIILITVVVKIILYPLTKKQTVSMAKMRNLQPKMQALKERYGDDRQKMGPAMMKLYKEEQVNPMGGCLPLLLQMPIFLSLYWMLMESVELRHAEFIFWITDLSTKDPFYVLPVLYGASMFLMQKLQPTPTTDPMQQKVMMYMPVVFSVLFVIFPAGLVLYWLVNNLISIMQTLYIYRQIDKKGLDKPKDKKAAKAAK